MASLWQEQMDIARRMLLVLCGIAAMVGLFFGAQMMMAPDGSMIGFDVSLLSKFPGDGAFFADYFGSGVLFLLAVFLPNAVTVLLAVLKKPVAYYLCVACGVILIVLNVAIIIFLLSFMEFMAFIVGALQIMAGIRCIRANRALNA